MSSIIESLLGFVGINGIPETFGELLWVMFCFAAAMWFVKFIFGTLLSLMVKFSRV